MKAHSYETTTRAPPDVVQDIFPLEMSASFCGNLPALNSEFALPRSWLSIISPDLSLVKMFLFPFQQFIVYFFESYLFSFHISLCAQLQRFSQS
jgi:hypothetical protein